MKYLLDNNVLSEFSKPRRDPDVIRWVQAQQPDDLCTSVIVIGEIRFGIERMVFSRRRTELDVWLRRELPGLIRGGILPVDEVVAERYGRVRAKHARQGHLRGELDTWIIATAQVYGLAVATRNFHDFGGLGVGIVNPWDLEGVKDMPGTDRW